MRTPTLYRDDGSEQQLPTHWEICDNCRGDGQLPLQGIVITADDWADWDDDDRHEYMHGTAYNSNCVECGGSGKIRVVDEDQLDEDTLAEWHRQLDEIADMRAMEAAERRMGA